MRKHPAVAKRPPVDVCMCFGSFVCRLHRDDGREIAKEEADALGDECADLCVDLPLNVRTGSVHCPWNPDELPERLRGFGHRMADQDGGNGSEWVTPEEDHAEQMLEAARVLLDAREVL